jgi:chaperonin GroEL
VVLSRNVVWDQKRGAPTITNDGGVHRQGDRVGGPVREDRAELVKEVAKKTDDVAGDGTTTATVLAH